MSRSPPIDWPHELQQAVANRTSNKDLAERLGVHHTEVSRQRRKHGLSRPYRPRDRSAKIDWPSELAEAERRGLSNTEIAERLGVDRPTVTRQRRRHGFSVRPHTRRDWAAELADALSRDETAAAFLKRTGADRSCLRDAEGRHGVRLRRTPRLNPKAP